MYFREIVERNKYNFNQSGAAEHILDAEAVNSKPY
jgi:hypothetical protein